MKSIEDVIKQNADSVYLWTDGETLDFLINTKNISFIEDIIACKCLRCDTLLINKNVTLVKTLNDNVSGIHIKCSGCKQNWYVHRPIIIPKNL